MNWTKKVVTFEKKIYGENRRSLRHDIKHPSESIEGGYTIEI